MYMDMSDHWYLHLHKPTGVLWSMQQDRHAVVILPRPLVTSSIKKAFIFFFFLLVSLHHHHRSASASLFPSFITPPRSPSGSRSTTTTTTMSAASIGRLHFVYGTLMSPEVLTELIGRVPPLIPGRLMGYQRYRVPGQGKHRLGIG